ncbi:MAG: IclR family transcriptional regulator [Dehalococcoidia bacterium]|nr:IclR family transcriptional regulator [Dehalococcoidia bacterium]
MRSVERAIDIISYVADQDGATSLRDVSRDLGLSKSTVHRILSSLQAKAIVAKDPDSRYAIGPRVIRWGRPSLHQGALASVVLPFLYQLRDDADETVSFHLRVHAHQVAIEQVESRKELRRTLDLGKMAPLGLGAPGKAMLAYLPQPEKLEVFRILDAHGFPPDRIDALEEELAAVRLRGVALSFGERVPVGAAVSAPVFGNAGRVVGAIALSGPANRLRVKVLESHVDRVRDVASQISMEIGCDAEPTGFVASGRSRERLDQKPW